PLGDIELLSRAVRVTDGDLIGLALANLGLVNVRDEHGNGLRPHPPPLTARLGGPKGGARRFPPTLAIRDEIGNTHLKISRQVFLPATRSGRPHAPGGVSRRAARARPAGAWLGNHVLPRPAGGGENARPGGGARPGAAPGRGWVQG